MFQIETGIPIPPPQPKRPPANRKYPFPDLKPGQSFKVEGDDEAVLKAINAARGFRNRVGTPFVWRRIDHGVRIWRSPAERRTAAKGRRVPPTQPSRRA